jgi:hypothetical protein
MSERFRGFVQGEPRDGHLKVAATRTSLEMARLCLHPAFWNTWERDPSTTCPDAEIGTAQFPRKKASGRFAQDDKRGNGRSTPLRTGAR